MLPMPPCPSISPRWRMAIQTSWPTSCKGLVHVRARPPTAAVFAHIARALLSRPLACLHAPVPVLGNVAAFTHSHVHSSLVLSIAWAMVNICRHAVASSCCCFFTFTHRGRYLHGNLSKIQLKFP